MQLDPVPSLHRRTFIISLERERDRDRDRQTDRDRRTDRQRETQFIRFCITFIARRIYTQNKKHSLSRSRVVCHKDSLQSLLKYNCPSEIKRIRLSQTRANIYIVSCKRWAGEGGGGYSGKHSGQPTRKSLSWN